MGNKKTNIWKNGMELFQRFIQSSRIKEAEQYLANESKMKQLLKLVPFLFRQRALAPVLKNLVLLYHYVDDIVHHRYPHYNPSKLVLIVALLIYVVSPLDFIPDWIPAIGLLDDVSLVAFAVKQLDMELQRYFQWHNNTHKE